MGIFMSDIRSTTRIINGWYLNLILSIKIHYSKILIKICLSKNIFKF